MEVEIGHLFRNDVSMSDIIAAAAAGSLATRVDIEHAEVIYLGDGVLSWPRSERQSDRYGTVVLCTGPYGEGNVSFASAPIGACGHLVAIVLEIRPSVHCGDIAHGLSPSIPAVGEVIVLGSGTVFTDANPETGLPTAVGLTPDDGRDENWLDPRALYRCHNQTVRLELRAVPHIDHRRASTRRVA